MKSGYDQLNFAKQQVKQFRERIKKASRQIKIILVEFY